MPELRGLFKTFWGWLTRDTPELLASLVTWLAGDTWFEFGIRISLVCFVAFLMHSLWTRLADLGDRNPLVTIGGFAVLMVLGISALGAYYAGIWREVAPSWIP